MKFLNTGPNNVPLRSDFLIPGLFSLCFLANIFVLSAQQETMAAWTDIDEESISTQATRYIVPDAYRTLALDIPQIEDILQNAPDASTGSIRNSGFIMSIPMPDGSAQQFRVAETSIMEAPLRAQFPQIKTYTGEGIDDPSAYLKMDLTEQGFHAMILSSGGSVFIDPYAHLDNRYYISYYKKDLQRTRADFSECFVESTDDALERKDAPIDLNRQQPDCQKRTYRLALAGTGEYTAFHGGNVSGGLSAMNTTMNRVNGVYERDLGITMILVANNNLLVYTNAATDPYSNNSSFTMLGQNQTNCNSVIGSSNYDIGHVFSTGGGGVASLNSPCTSSKARGVSGQFTPIGDPFDIDYVAHEMGHQYGGNHTQNNSCNRSSASYEPGSASTIMGYAGICSPNVQSNSDAMFHAINIQEISNNVVFGNSSGCPVTASTGNSSPNANAGSNYTIPKSTPYMLTGVATDPNPGDALTYSWEQWDPEVGATMPPAPTNTTGPMTRTRLPISSPSRTIPPISNIVNNSTNTWDVLNSVGRNLEWRFTVRDNFPGAGCTDEDNMNLTVTNSAGPFIVTAPNTAVTWQANATNLVTWNVANTNNSPVNSSNVDIFLSTDGGFTYPITLATNVPNTGSANVNLPSIASTTARIKVQGSNNIFFDISNTNFTIDNNNPGQCNAVTNLFASNITPGTVRLNWNAVPGADHYEIRGFLVGFPGQVNLSVPAGAPNFKDVIGLSAGTEYWWEIITYCDAAETNASPWSEKDTFQTQACPATALSFTNNITATTVRLNWAAVAGATGYTIRGRQVGGPFITLNVSGALTTFFDVIDLTPSTLYEWQVAANCGFVASPYTSLMPFATTAGSASKASGSFGSAFKGISLYPNPSSGLVTIKTLDFDPSEQAFLEILDLNGQLVKQLNISNLQSESLQLDLSNLQAGVYNVVIANSTQREIRKLILMK